MSSASEQIKALQAKQAAERAAREAAEQKAAAASQRESQRVEDEHKRKLQHSKEVADRVLHESGVLEEIKAIKRDHIDGKFPKSALFINYDDDLLTAELTLAWGESFSVKKDKEGNSQIIEERQLLGRRPLDYNYFNVFILTEEESFMISTPFHSEHFGGGWSTTPEKISSALTNAFLHPGTIPTPYDSMDGYIGEGPWPGVSR